MSKYYKHPHKVKKRDMSSFLATEGELTARDAKRLRRAHSKRKRARQNMLRYNRSQKILHKFAQKYPVNSLMWVLFQSRYLEIRRRKRV